MLRRGLAVLVVVGAMGAWGASSAAAQESVTSTSLALLVCTAPGSCEVVPIIDQPHNATLDLVLSTGLGLGSTAQYQVCSAVGQQEIPLGNGGKLLVCPALQQYHRRRDLLRYVAADGQTYAVGTYDRSNHLCLRGEGVGAYSGESYEDEPIVELRHYEYPCTV